MNFKKALLNARIVGSLLIDESMVLRRMDNGIEITYELEDGGELLQFKSCHIARVGDHVVRGDMGKAVLIPKAEFAARFTEIGSDLILEVSDDERYVTASFVPPGGKGELRLIMSAAKPLGGGWIIKHAEDLMNTNIDDARRILTAFELVSRKVKELDV